MIKIIAINGIARPIKKYTNDTFSDPYRYITIFYEKLKTQMKQKEKN